MMTLRSFGFLLLAFAGLAGLVWLANAFTMLVAVVFGFTAFGLIFMGMLCVLPGLACHPVAPHVSEQPVDKVIQPTPARTATAFNYGTVLKTR